MLRTFLYIMTFIVPIASFGQSAAEEAIILNEELKYLEDSVKNIQAKSLKTDAEETKTKALNERSLEKMYFQDAEEDAVSTRTASPKRRREL
jgi:hypothetical protein